MEYRGARRAGELKGDVVNIPGLVIVQIDLERFQRNALELSFTVFPPLNGVGGNLQRYMLCASGHDAPVDGGFLNHKP